MKNRHVAAARNFKNERLAGAIRRKVQLDALPQLSGIHSDNIVLASVVSCGSPKNLSANLLFVDLRGAVLEGLFSDV